MPTAIGVIAAGELDALAIHVIHRAHVVAATADHLHMLSDLFLKFAHASLLWQAGETGHQRNASYLRELPRGGGR